MDIFSELSEMQERILGDEWEAFRSHYFNKCECLAPSVAQRILNVDLVYYSDRQFDAYCKALKKARSANASAIYFEYDIDNDWESTFFVCKEYSDPGLGDDDWACSWSAQIRGSCIPEFAKIYNTTEKFCETPSATAITLLLIARTTEELRTTVAKKSPDGRKICIGFHDQDPIHRLSI